MDLDGDGHRDILSGSYSRMEQDMAGLFQVLRGKPDGTFKEAEVLKGTDGQPLIIPTKEKDKDKDQAHIMEKICTRPFAIDWDGDEKLDLVVGTFAGTFYCFKGEGKGKFQPKPEVIKAGAQPLRIQGHHSDPFVIDWDGDGDLDILSGSSSGGVQWAENKAGKGKPPEFSAFETLIAPGKPIVYGQSLKEQDLTGPTHSTRIWVQDINGDGKVDILVGDSVTLVSPAKGLSEEEFQVKQKAWQKEMDALAKVLSSDATVEKREKANQELSKHYEKRATFMKEGRTGFVWLYLRK